LKSVNPLHRQLYKLGLYANCKPSCPLLYMCSLAAWFVVVVVVVAVVLLWQQQVRCLSLLFALRCGRHL